MIGICPSCGNHKWEKEVLEHEIHCPACDHRWTFQKLPVYFLTGCSGVGKTSTGQALQQLTDDYVILDADMFYNIIHPQNDAEYHDMVEQALSLSKNINQSGKPVVWTMAGCIDKLHHTYNARFFRQIHVLALTADEATLRRRMTVGRGIEDPDWIQSSVDYNEYFKTHTTIGDTPFETLDCSGQKPEETAVLVLEWLKKQG